MSQLAINGGPKVRTKPFPSQNTYGPEEVEAVSEVVRSGRCSHYQGNWTEHFYGGPEIKALEREWQNKFHTRHAICCNSATSGLFIACRALGIGPGEEVIVSPYSMTCSATIPLACGATPVFADVEEDCFCLDPKSVEERITERTRAIIVVSLFGQPYDMEINRIAIKHGLVVIEDAAQALGSTYGVHSIHAGNLGDIGVYSFNYGKHISAGEGGMIVTNDEDLAFRCRLTMNHAESVVNDMESELRHIETETRKLIGFNLRMTELQATIIRIQLRKFDELLKTRLRNEEWTNDLQLIPPISPAKIRPSCSHTYYALPFKWDQEKAEGIHRNTFIEAVKAELTPRKDRDGEGIQIGCGYIKPIYLMPLFQSQKEWIKPNWQEGSCPVVEKLWRDELFLTLYHAPNSTNLDMQDFNTAFYKVWEHRKEL